MAKNNSKSVRLSDKVMHYIMSYPVGNGFNEKFENIIIYAMETEEYRRREIENLDDQISRKREDYYALCDKLRKLEPMVQGALHINSRIIQLNKEFDDCISKIVFDPGNPQKE